MSRTGYLACPWRSGVLTVTPSAASSLTVQADLPGTGTRAGPSHHAASPGGHVFALASLLPPASPRTLPTPGLRRHWEMDGGGRRDQA